MVQSIDSNNVYIVGNGLFTWPNELIAIVRGITDIVTFILLAPILILLSILVFFIVLPLAFVATAIYVWRIDKMLTKTIRNSALEGVVIMKKSITEIIDTKDQIEPKLLKPFNILHKVKIQKLKLVLNLIEERIEVENELMADFSEMAEIINDIEEGKEVGRPVEHLISEV